MAARNRLPDSSVMVRTYAELDKFVRGFVECFSLLILIGRPGIQKSTVLRQAIGESVCWLEGNVTPFGMYQQLYHHANQLVVIDDVDSLYSDRNGVRLLKSLCQSERRKTLSWFSDSRSLERKRIPMSFATTSRVAIVANDWKSLNENVMAVEDRGHVVVFDPNADEVHRRTGNWFKDEEIYDFIGEQLRFIDRHSMRLYFRAAELKRAGMDWKSLVLSQLMTGPALLVAQLQADSSYPSEAMRVEEFVSRGAGTRSTYYSHAKRLRECG